jgi:hypothetical protein
LIALSSTLISTCSSNTLSRGTRGRSAGKCVVSERSRNGASRRVRAAPTTSSRGCHSLCTWMAPDSRRVIANKLLTRRLSRSASAWAVCRSSWRVGASSRLSSSRRVLVAPVMAVSGVRRSCETELSREFRRRSVSTWSCACWASSARRARSSARAVWLAKVSSKAPCSGVSKRRGWAGSTPRTPTVPRAATRGRYSASALGRVVVPRPAMC